MIGFNRIFTLHFFSCMQIETVHKQQQDMIFSQSVKDFEQSPVGVFIDRPTSTGPDTEAGTTSVHSRQALHRSPNHSVHSRERLPSGLLKNFRVGGEDAASKRSHLSVDISGSNDSPDGCNLSDKHERMSGLLPSVRALTAPAGSVASGSDDEQETSPPVTLTGSEKNPSCSNSNPMRAKNSPAEHTNSQEVVHEALIMGDEERGLGHLIPETTFGKEAQETPGLQGYFFLTTMQHLLFAFREIDGLQHFILPFEDFFLRKQAIPCGLFTFR